MIGRRLGQYEILEKLGEGGMGQVWKARDTQLDREVAIKVLPEAFAQDADRLARFEREAKLLASLNHPGIAVVHGLHEEEGIRFLAMELVPGEDLSLRLHRGPLPVEEALRVGLQVSEALEAAHARGVVHRDLKPANIVVAPDGKTKVLDFGLAKGFEADATSTSHSPSLSPTVTSAGTVAGVILGTAAYMSPEQARGKPLDKRTDIWSFGCVLYECLTGKSQFHGESVSDSIGAILHKQPEWAALPPITPPTTRLLLRRCLTRDADSRLHDIADARIDLEQALGDPDGTGLSLIGISASGESAGSAQAKRRLAPWMLGVVAIACIVIGALAGSLLLDRPESAALRKYDLGVDLQQGQNVDPEARISPDGTQVAFINRGKIWVQALDELEPRELDDTDGAEGIFWSPDSAELGYFGSDKLWKISALGGRPIAVCDLGGDVAGGRGASWGDDNHIVFTRGNSGLLRVSALGGEATELLPPAEDEGDLHEPSVLPDGRGILFVAHPNDRSPGVLSLLRGQERSVLWEPSSEQTVWRPGYASSGHILFRRAGGEVTPGLWALPFSLGDLEVTGEPFLVVPDASAGSTSQDGTLVFIHRPPNMVDELMVWYDRTGRRLDAIGGPRRGVNQPSLSPDGRRLAFATMDEDNQLDLWVLDLERGAETRLTVDNNNFEFVFNWTPAGDEIIFSHFMPEDGVSFNVVPANGSSPPRQIAGGVAFDLSPDGQYVTVVRPPEGDPKEIGPTGPADVWLNRVDGSEEPRPLIQSPARDVGGAISPDGRYMSFTSDRSGANEVYLTRFPSAQGRWQVSVGGGEFGTWDSTGDRLYFQKDSTFMEVTVELGDEPRLGRPQPLFEVPQLAGGQRGVGTSPEGERFIVIERAPGTDDDDSQRSGIKIVQSWIREFEN
jgi:hypothetical protein